MLVFGLAGLAFCITSGTWKKATELAAYAAPGDESLQQLYALAGTAASLGVLCFGIYGFYRLFIE